MAHVITFDNHSPIRIADADAIETVWDANQEYGHHELRRYTTKRGNTIYWISANSGMYYGNSRPKTTRTYMRDAEAIRTYFYEMDSPELYHAEIEAQVDPASIIDVDAL